MRNSGISLAETIFSLFIVSLIVILVSSLYPGSMLSVKRSEHRLVASNLAQSTLEEYLQRPFDELDEGDHLLPPHSEAGVDFERTLTVLRDSEVDFDLLRGYRVTVNWEFRVQQKLTREQWRARVSR